MKRLFLSVAIILAPVAVQASDWCTNTARMAETAMQARNDGRSQLEQHISNEETLRLTGNESFYKTMAATIGFAYMGLPVDAEKYGQDVYAGCMEAQKNKLGQ